MADLNIALRIRADLQQAIRQIDRLEKELNQTGRAGDRAGKGARRAASSFERMQAAAGRARSAISPLKGAIAGFSAVLVGREIVQAGLEIERLHQRFRFATGSAAGARREMEFTRQEARRLGIDFRGAADAYSSLAAAARGTNLEGAETREIFTAISEASRVLQLDAAQTGGALTAIEQIISKGKVSAEELRGQLGERLPGAFQIAARAMGVTTQELDEMLQQGELLADEFLPKFARELRRAFADDVPQAAQSAQASFERLGNAIDRLAERIANSGLIDRVAALAEAVERLLGALDATPPEERLTRAQQRAQEAEAARDRILRQAEERGILPIGEARGFRDTRVSQELIDRAVRAADEAIIAAAEETLESLQAALEEQRTTGQVGPSGTNAEILAIQRDIEIFRAQLGLQPGPEPGPTPGPGPQPGPTPGPGPQDPYEEIIRRIARTGESGPGVRLEARLIEAERWLEEIRTIYREAGIENDTLVREFEEAYEGMVEAATESYRRQLLEGQGFVGGMRTVFMDLAAEAQDGFELGRQAAENAFRGMEDALVDFARTGKLEVRDLVNSIIADLARIVIRQQITGPLAGGLADALGGIFGAPVAHGGAIAGQAGGRSRFVDAGAFIGAPRLHRGGISGLRSDEIPTILRRGEGVFTPEQMAALAPAYAQSGKIEVVNSGSPKKVVDADFRIDIDGIVTRVVLEDLDTGGPVARRLEAIIPGTTL
ncbi:MAG: tape measure protein [Rhodobacteraceae bacterium]|nr:tape measure protein [Paracoccaceae bacterium]